MQRREWNEEEEAFLRENYLKYSPTKIGKILKRTAISVYHKQWRLGLRVPKDVRNKRISKATMGRCHSKETRRKISETKKRLYAEGKLIAWKMKPRPKKEELRALYWKKGLGTNKIAKLFNVTKGTISRWMKEYDIPRRGPSEAQIKYIAPPKSELTRLYYKEGKRIIALSRLYNVSVSVIRRWFKKYNITIKPWKKKMLLIRNRDPRFRRLVSQKKTKWWKNLSPKEKKNALKHLFEPDVRKRVLKINKPTSIERKFIQLCTENRLPFSYVGNGRFWIGKRNPDFINSENRLVIEVLGSYWHNKEEAKERVEYFRKKNYKCLLIWDYEFKNPDLVVNKVRRWMDANIICKARLG